jgi:hypothetical protein
VLIVDDRERGVVDELRRLDIEVSVARLEFGDCAFTGRGPGGGEVTVGCERKRLGDLVSSMQDRRLSGHQLRGMRQAYDYLFLFVESVWRPGANGEIEELQGREFRAFYSRGKPGDRAAVSYRQLTAYLTTLELRGGVVVRRTANARETASQYVALWHWWNDKAWDAHKSMEAVYCNGVVKKGHGGGWADPHEHDEEFAPGGRASTLSGAPTTLLRTAMQLPGILDVRAAAVTERFGSIRRMALAGLPTELLRVVEEWLDTHPEQVQAAWQVIDGVGKKTSAAVVRAIAEKGA